MKRLTLFLITVFFVGVSAAGIKYVAVVESDVDAASGASAVINPAEVREITAEFRRQATEHLPSDRYSVMTSETIQSMGGAVLEECSEENCVVALGAKIGADFIVRGTINKFGARLTLAVEMYETDNGTLVASSEAVRAQSIEELLDKGAVACANMYKKFVDKQKPAAAAVADDAGQQAGKKGKAKKEKPAAKEKTMAGAGGEQGEGAEWKEGDGSGWKEVSVRVDYALKYQFPVGTPISWGGVGIEIEFVRRGWGWGDELLFGVDKDNLLLGVGFNVGKGYNLGNQMQIVYGGSFGFWMFGGEDGIGIAEPDEWDFCILLAPRVKYRWRFLEVSASWFFGARDHRFREYYDYDDYGYYDYGSAIKSEMKFYHCPQIMAGFYIKGRTVTTRTQVTREKD